MSVNPGQDQHRRNRLLAALQRKRNSAPTL